MARRHTTARLSVAGERYEILVAPDAALEYKQGQDRDIARILVADAIFTDSSKGLRASEEQLQKAFQTVDVFEVARAILRRGELQLTADQRSNLVEEKRKQIVAFISRRCIDPRTGSPHPPLRVEQAMEQARVVVDPFKPGEEQARMVIDALRPILPLRIEDIRVAVKVPPEYASQAIGVVKDFGGISRSEWQSDGSWIAVLEMPAGLHTSLLDRLARLTHGNYQTKILR
jgi:ribosome maturation protein SDO1